MEPNYWELQREKLVRHIATRGVLSTRVLWAMGQVPREQFVPEVLAAEAYEDKPLPIGWGQTISQPSIVAMMTEALDPQDHHRVLEIGTGTGYQTAILALLGGQIVTVERIPSLIFAAAKRVSSLGLWNVFYILGDGTLGWPDGAPYDRILVTASAPEIPPPLWQQLNEDGVMVIPIGSRDEQVLYRITKRQGNPIWFSITPCRFVPLLGLHGWLDPPATVRNEPDR
jgi:protein-L-isoaspartate(D-aspartate) O-methyltransferase